MQTDDIITTGLLAGFVTIAAGFLAAVAAYGFILANLPPAGGMGWLVAFIVAFAVGYVATRITGMLVRLSLAGAYTR